MNIVRRFLRLFLLRQFRLTDHALEALDEHELTLNDIVACPSEGELRRSWPRQRKYEIAGRSADGREIRVVIRLLSPSLIRIITVYEVD